MTLTSFSFYALSGILIGLYYLLPGRFQTWLLLLFSGAFCYFAGGKRMLLFLTCSIIITWLGALLLEKAESARRKKAVLFWVLFFHLGMLFVFKYLNFFVYTSRIISDILGKPLSVEEISLAAPLGMSFYTLQQIGYLLDVSRNTVSAEKSLLRYGVFAGFFPQLLQGPINRYSDMAETLYTVKRFDYERIAFGLQRMLWGIFKKLVISERMAVLVGTIYGDYVTYSGLYIVIGTVCFAIQLYTDFSGAMDIALGLSEMLGIRLAENFETPFFSTSISEYWRRWHITLGAWMKDYVFYPLLKSDLFVSIGDIAKKHLGKKRGKKVPTYLGMVVLWFTVGFWHGGAWKYIIGSGLLHCFYIISGQLLEPCFQKTKNIFHIRTECFSYRLFQQLRTFTLVCVGFVFFRAAGTKTAIGMLKASFYPNIWIFIDGSLLKLGLDFHDFTVGMVSVGVLLLVSILQEKLHREGKTVRGVLAEQNLWFRWGVYYALIFAILILGFYGPGYSASEFIYQNF